MYFFKKCTAARVFFGISDENAHLSIDWHIDVGRSCHLTWKCSKQSRALKKFACLAKNVKIWDYFVCDERTPATSNVSLSHTWHKWWHVSRSFSVKKLSKKRKKKTRKALLGAWLINKFKTSLNWEQLKLKEEMSSCHLLMQFPWKKTQENNDLNFY